jgi:lambda repressor-like predicted transcriptional regulator
MARSRSFENPMPPEGAWIKYQLDLRNIKMDAVAKKAGRTVATVSRVISKTRHSEKVEAVLAEMLGYPTYKDLWVDAFINAERRAV